MAKKEGISIFDSARSRTPSASVSKKDDKEVVFVDGLEAKLLELDVVKAQVKDLTAQEKSLNSEIKDIAKEKFVELYQSKRANPNTFLIRSGSGCVMVIPSDAYLKIDSEARANELIDAYGEDAVEVDEQFIFNNDVLERNMKAIEKAIKESKSITDDDKRDLIDRKVKYSVAKGFIDKLGVYGKNIELVMNDVQPTISLKSCGSRMEDGGELDGDFIGNVYDDDTDDGGGVEDDGELYYTRDYFEYVDWSGDGNNDGYLYGINLLDDNGDVLDAEWFESDQERINYVLENNLFEYKFKRGGKVDGRSTRAKNTWNSGGAWTRDRNAHNKSEDWEKPMRSRKNKYADGGGVEKFNIGDKVKVVKGANKGVKGVISNTDSDFFGDYTIDVRGHKLYGFKADSLIKLPKYKMMADGGAVKTVFTKDGVEVEKGTDKYKGHIFYHSDGVGYMCLGYFPNLDDCKYRNMETGVEVVGCMDGFYYYDPMIFIPSYSHGGMHGGKISTATLEAMVGRKLNGWNDDVVYFNGAKYQKLYLQPFYVIA